MEPCKISNEDFKAQFAGLALTGVTYLSLETRREWREISEKTLPVGVCDLLARDVVNICGLDSTGKRTCSDKRATGLNYQG